eukprot:ANDGO_03800.mRNA.1 hypothetical protein
MSVTSATLRKTCDISTAAGTIRSIHAGFHRMHCLADVERAIATCFVARHSGQRSAENRRKRARGESSESEDVPVDEPKISSAKVARRSALDLQRRPLVKRDENQVPRPVKRVIALDPGVRTFAAGYDPSGRMIEVGAKDASCIYRLCMSADKLSSKIAEATTARQRLLCKSREFAWRQVSIVTCDGGVHV